MNMQTLRMAPLAAALATLLAAPAFGATSEEAGEAARDKPKRLPAVEVVGFPESYSATDSSTATRTDTALRDIPQAITVVTQGLIRDQAMQGMADIVRYVPGVGMAQGEGNRDTPIFRGNSSTADMFIDGMRDDVQYFRDLYNIDRVEALKGPNAMIFGRGGSGGLLNRVSKQADWTEQRGAGLQTGSWSKQRLTTDLGHSVSDSLSLRVTGLFEESSGFRDGYEVERRGLNPTMGWRAGAATTVTFGYEHFDEERTADRGVPSFQGRPVDTDPSTFFGDADRSTADARVDAFNMLLEHEFGNGVTLRNRLRHADYDKFYQNIFPGTVFANGTVAISAYNTASQRENLFNQTDLIMVANTGGIEHKLLLGAEFGRQETDNFRETGYFPASACPSTGSLLSTTSTCVSLADPSYEGTVTFAQSGSDADNHGVARVAAAYLQDQLRLSSKWQAVLGLRFDRFEVDLHNNRNGVDLASTDSLWSPRAGLIYQPIAPLSLYASYSLAFLPRSGEQLASLSATNAALEPESFRNVELGAKWDIQPELAATLAVYQLERSNVAVVDPADPSRLILLAGDSQRVRGVELGLSGQLSDRWSVMGGYAYQDAKVTRDIPTSATAVLPAGTVLAQVPRHAFSLWNRYDIGARFGVGLGMVARGKVFTSTSNTVELPGFVRFDGALYFRIGPRAQLQLNVENLFNHEYFASAHSDTNISPGSPRAFNLGLNLDY